MRVKPKILCVDDEARVLEGLALLLRRQFEVHSAVGGAPALAILERDQDFAVIVSDIRMPNMDGITFLSHARKIAPDAVRVLLTGTTDSASIIASVNQAGVFRFVSKPCAPAELAAVLGEALEQHRTITAERVLLEQTLRASVQTIMDVLALVQPTIFGRATRIARLAAQIAEHLGVGERWSLEVAAMLSELGTIVLPQHVGEKLSRGETLTADEEAMVAQTPTVTEELIGHIPRLDMVRAILAAYAGNAKLDPGWNEVQRQAVVRGGQILAATVEFARHEAQGVALAMDILSSQPESFNAEVLDALGLIVGTGDGREVRELPLSQIREGMIIMDDLRTVGNVLLCHGNFEVSRTFVERARNFRPGSVREPIRVSIPIPPPEKT